MSRSAAKCGAQGFCPGWTRDIGNLLLVGLLLWLPAVAYGSEDFRMTVEIPAEKVPGVQPSLVAVMHEAVPVLWDRLIPQAKRAASGRLTGTPRMVSRIVPATDVTTVIFDRRAVFDYLDQSHVSYLASPPAIHLAIQMRNSVGMPMHRTEALLDQYARDLAQQWGFRLSASAPELLVRWSWLDASRLRLTLEGAAAPVVAPQERSIGQADPMVFVQAWLKAILLDARDRLGAVSNQKKPSGQDGTSEIWLVIDRPLKLGEQAVLEDAIRSDPRVLELIPHTYSRQRLRYRLIVAGRGTDWIATWFRQRAFDVISTPDGLSLH